MSPSPPMFGTVVAELLEVSPVSIHGDEYFDVLAMIDPASGSVGSASPIPMRVPRHLCSRAPCAGDHVRLEFLMQQVTSLAFVE
jgi:hypothetical protein